MAERIQKTKTTTETKTETDTTEAKVPENTEALKDEMDELLDEIDGLLEENAMEFVKNYIQKGGE